MIKQAYESMSEPRFGSSKFGFGFTPTSVAGWACVILFVPVFTTVEVLFS